MRKALPVLLRAAVVVVMAVEARKEEAAAGKGTNAQVWCRRGRRRRRGRRLERGRRERAIACVVQERKQQGCSRLWLGKRERSVSYRHSLRAV